MQLIALTLVTILFGLLNSFVMAEPSAVPNSGYTCPLADKSSYALGVTNYSSDPFVCSYPLIPGTKDTTFTCSYSKTTGNLVVDKNDNLCPKSAVAPVTRRNNRVARNALPARPTSSHSIPAGRSEKTYMKKRRL